MRLWVDTDIGDNPDDAVALLTAAAHPSVELVGVSTVGVDAPRRMALARSLVPVPVVDGTTPQQLLDTVGAAAPEVLLAIGPLSNVAHLLGLELALPRVVVMGGVLQPIRHRGEIRDVESNFAADPLAAASVLATAAPTIVPLDVTAGLALDLAQVDRLVAARPDLGAAVMAWFERLEVGGVPEEERRVVLHDPLAVLAVVHDPCLALEPRYVAVDPVTGRLLERPNGTRCDVATRVDRRAALATILALVEAA